MIEVTKPGLLTTIQDLGRRGYQKYGVSPGGAADMLAHRLANIAIGNVADAATLEMTLQGDELSLQEAALISITGADMNPEIDGKPLPMWRPVYVEKGKKLLFRNAGQGLRTYVAIEGGIQGDLFLGSTSTYLSMEAGGYSGRALKEGDMLQKNGRYSLNEEISDRLKHQTNDQGFAYTPWRLPDPSFFQEEIVPEIRVFPGPHYQLFDAESRQAFERGAYQTGSKSDRMGIRFDGEKLTLRNQEEIISEPVTFGTIQVPANGQPILLLADRQTTGGYPKLAQVASVDFSKVAQLRPGEETKFRMITHREAEQLFLCFEDRIQQCALAVRRKVREEMKDGKY
ncbi:5-oxoprolinase subunit C family protein [Salimicrobium flavidum]|uniref:Antagonist of KipI n=1 Tax=Salimicrobium flavidum TaxID=570947 RepID=A0A1N7JJF7_9BACI|nr:biotin-dependent carboxyltransferase family protein [Salimicrobium flavidum]SIS49401.1 antagonist of KipI [Salimicrobium flavidum]